MSRVPPDPNAPIAPLPLHLHPPPARSGFCMSPHGLTLLCLQVILFCWTVCFHSGKNLLTPTLLFLHFLFTSTLRLLQSVPQRTRERRGLNQSSCSFVKTECMKSPTLSLWKKMNDATQHFFLSALHPCVVCHRRKESLDSKPSSQKKKISDHVKKERFCVWKRYCLTFVVENQLAVNPQILSLYGVWFMMNPLLAVWPLACFCRKDLLFSKESKKHSDDTERERLASHKCENLVSCGETAVVWLLDLMHEELSFFFFFNILVLCCERTNLENQTNVSLCQERVVWLETICSQKVQRGCQKSETEVCRDGKINVSVYCVTFPSG